MFAYALFDTAIGRCALAWGPRGIIGAQLPERNPESTRIRLMRLCPNADEQEPPKQIARAIEDISALLRGEKKSLRAVQLDMSRVPAFNARVYETTRAIAPGARHWISSISCSDSGRTTAVLQPPGQDLTDGPTISSHFHPDERTHVTQNRYVGGWHMRAQLGPMVDDDRRLRRAGRVLAQDHAALGLDHRRGHAELDRLAPQVQAEQEHRAHRERQPPENPRRSGTRRR